MPSEQFVVTGDVGGCEYPSGGRLFTLLPEAQGFAEAIKLLPGARGYRIERQTPQEASAVIDSWNAPPPPPDANLAVAIRDGKLVIIDADGNEVAETVDPRVIATASILPPHLENSGGSAI